ncbi:hypothetical protein GCM10012278_61980 [Nonomuraea glycinis]|uniref:PD-(D/E)XK motif protein n=2 Tax=Nonomuraea glycinis TaxID=2047744 RepID=A0A918E8T6_9ACTN|nr:hypothetical protein GCM10012278_61980 [Nonomuraea glycinis]
MEHPIAGHPRLTLFIDPKHREIGLRAQVTVIEPRRETGLEHVQLRPVHRGNQRFLEVVISEPLLFTSAYPLLCAVADGIQLQGLSLGTALNETIRLLGRLLTHADRLSTEKELGLFGELMLFLGLIRVLGPQEALWAWRGPDREEHDFGLLGHDVEVKTTGAERRAHWIGSLTQLLPNKDRPLWLVSHQLTQAESTDGRTLPELVNAVQHDIGDHRLELDHHLHAAGWREQHEKTCRTRWRLRGKSMAFAVVDTFPSLTPTKLRDVTLARISDVRYRIDLTDHPIGATTPQFLIDALDQGATI